MARSDQSDSSATVLSVREQSSRSGRDRPAAKHRAPDPGDSLQRRIDPQAGPTELGQYVLLRELGRGAIGIVYAAYHEGLDRKLAIKVLNRARAGRADLEARLRREARALARLSHPNVVQVYDVGELEGRVYVVMEFVEGQTLSEWMRQPHSIEEILAMFADAGRGLAAAHAAGVVHRDFKPDNVIVGADGRPRVLDFGLARALRGEAEHTSGDAQVRADRAERAELALARRITAAEQRSQQAIGADPDKLRELDASGTVDGGSLAEGELAGPDRARQALPSRDEGDPHQNVHTREGEPANEAMIETCADPDAPDEPDEFDIDPELLVTERSEPGPRGRPDDVLTRTGALMGTPAYMSPEQFMAKAVDQSSDQFSFCVALHEALYGRRPYSAKNQADLIVQVHAGSIIEAPADSAVPEWLRAVILRGLSPQRIDRWPSMDDLIAALEPPAKVDSRRRWVIGLLSAGVAALALAIGVLSPEREPACPTPEQALAKLWTPQRAAELGEAFAGSGSSYGSSAWATVEGPLSRWAQGWASQRVAACKAAQEDQRSEDPSAQVHDRRQACLVRNRRAFEALLAQFGEADRTMVEHAVEAVIALPEPARCGDLQALEAGVDAPPPEVAVEVGELRNHLAELDTRQTTGRWQSGLPLARAAVEQARTIGHAPVLAEALLTEGRLLSQSSAATAADEALARLQEALDEADRSAHHELVPLIATELVSLSIYAKPDPIRGRLWARRALTGLDRLARAREGEVSSEGAELGLARARGIWALGNLERLDGDNEQAEAHLREALELLDAHAPAHPERGIMLNDLGNVLAARGDAKLAREAYEQALRESLASFGAGHPRVGHTHFNLARLAQDQGELERAREQADLAFVIYAAARGLEHRDVGAVELLRAAIELADGNTAPAHERASRAKSIYDAALAPDNLDRAEPHQMLGNVAFTQGELDQALVEYRAALAIKRVALPPGHIELVPTLTNLGLVYMTRGEQAVEAGEQQAAHAEFDAAVAELEQSVDLLEAGEGVDPEWLRAHRLYLGDALLYRGDPGDHRQAVSVLEAGLRGCGGQQLCAELGIKAARAWAGCGEHERARARAREAKQLLERLEGDEVSKLLAQAEALLG